MRINPTPNKILVKRIEEKNVSDGGIIIPQTSQEKSFEGIVIEVGTGKISSVVKQGDRILFKKFAGTDISVDGEEYLIMNKDDILAIISE